jgi:hypothetical protein
VKVVGRLTRYYPDFKAKLQQKIEETNKNISLKFDILNLENIQ